MPEGKVAASAQRPPREAEQSGKTATEISDVQHRATRFNQVVLTLSVGAVVASSLYVLAYMLQPEVWQLLAEAGITVLALISAAVAYGLARRGKLDAAGYWIIFGVMIAYGGGELLVANATLYFAVGGVLLIILVGSMILPRKRRVWLPLAGLFGVYAWLVNWFEPLPRYDITQSILLTLVTAGVTFLVALAILWQIARAFRIGTIRTRLLVAFVTLTLLVATTTGIVSAVMGYRSGQEQMIAQLESVATLKEAEIETWVDTLQTELGTMLTGANAGQYTRILLQEEAPEPADYQEAHDKLQARFQKSLNWLEETFMMDLKGHVVLSSDATQEGKIHAGEAYFQRGLEDFYVHPPSYSPSLGRMSVIVAQPVFDQRGTVIGVLAGRAGMDTLSKIMLERAGLGQTGETYLIGTNHAMLTESRSGEEGIYVRTEGANAAIGNHAHGAGVYDGYWGEPVVGVYHWLPELEVALLAEQGQAEAFSSLYMMLTVNAGVVLVAVMLAVGASLFVTRSIANPLADLAETATQIAAGDLERVARVEREDEIGAVAQAFNRMTARLRDLVGSLEQRVAERTRDLERRSAYLEASAQVGHAAASILETDQLMRQVVDLIREQFGLYYVGLFLVEGEWAVLRAGTGEAGRIMLARGHRLRVGAGMIGWSIANAQARVALEAGEDAVRRVAAELPETRSEAALPLRSRGRVIGALTVQHVQPGAFDRDTIVVLQTMADQVAVALDNARLFAEAQAAMEAEHRAYGELSRAAWRDLLRARPDLAYRSDEHGVTGAGDVWRPEMEQAWREGRTVQIPNSQSPTPNPLAVPIKVRGHVIGVLDTHKPGDAGAWTPEEVALLEALTGRLGEALESARLFQDTQRRAAREQLTREITDKMRRAVSVEGIAQTAVDELYRVLGTSRAFVRLGVVLSPQKGAEEQRSQGAEVQGSREEGK